LLALTKAWLGQIRSDVAPGFAQPCRHFFLVAIKEFQRLNKHSAVQLTGSWSSTGLTQERRIRPMAIEAIFDCIAASMRTFQVPSAKNAAHGYGINKMRVGRTLAVGAGLGHHCEPLVRCQLLNES
jgi:hypothetical protein